MVYNGSIKSKHTLKRGNIMPTTLDDYYPVPRDVFFLHIADDFNSVQYTFVMASSGRMVITETVDGIERDSHIWPLVTARKVWASLRKAGYQIGSMYVN